METDIRDPSGDNVQDMEENNIYKYRSDPTYTWRRNSPSALS
jgi:hypothetical protein